MTEKENEPHNNDKSEDEPLDRSWTVFSPGGAAALTVTLVVCAIFGLLTPGLLRWREQARRQECVDNMRQIVKGLLAYHDVFDAWPPAYTVADDGTPLHSWRVLILPYMDDAGPFGAEYYRQNIRLDEPWDSEHNRRFHEAVPRVFRCPSFSAACSPDDARGLCSYSLVTGRDTLFAGRDSFTAKEIPGGAQYRAILVERADPVPWMAPDRERTADEMESGDAIGRLHANGTNVAFADGSVRFISNGTDKGVWRRMLRMNVE